MPIKKRRNTHQTHLESLVLLGPDGIEELDDKFEGMLDMLEDNSDRLNTTVKIDGRPRLFCWSHYDGYPDNSIALKGFVSGPQTALSSVEEIDQKYPSEDRANMREMLKYGLELAKYIPSGECWQGDCLFTKDSKRTEEILGKEYITFQPNKIIYAFSEDNPGYEEVKNADFGIAFHTIYSGQDKKQSFKVDVSRLNVPSSIYVMSPALTVNKKSFNLGKLKSGLDRFNQAAADLLAEPNYDELCSNVAFRTYWDTFENASLADKKATTINETTFLNDLKDYIKNKQDKEFEKKLASLKTEKGREKATQKYNQDVDELATIIDSNQGLLKLIVRTFNLAAQVKMLLWEGFKQTQTGYETFYKSKTKGHFKADMEGIRMSDQDGNIVKIVDRSAFSSYNRDPDIVGGWERESLRESTLSESIELYLSYGFSEEEAKELDRLKKQFPNMVIPKVDKETGHWVIPRNWGDD